MAVSADSDLGIISMAVSADSATYWGWGGVGVNKLFPGAKLFKALNVSRNILNEYENQ